MAMYATIAKQDSEAVKVEARADLDRSQATVIGLTEKLRNEMNIRLEGLERRSSAGDLSDDGVSRLARLERDLAAATGALQQCLHENEELRTQVAALVEHRMKQDGWLVSSGGTQALSPHLFGSHSWTSSISVPKLPLGCTNATVVPRLPG